MEHAARSGGFLQSYEWGEVLRDSGDEVVFVGFDDARALVVLRKLPFGFGYVYVPRGPVGGSALAEAGLVEEIVEKFSDNLFFRFDFARGNEFGKKCVSTLSSQPECTLITDLGLSEEELLAGMHSKTRYNVRLARKKGVEVVIGERGGEGFNRMFEDFIRLSEVMAKRQGIRVHSREYFRAILDRFNGEGDAPHAFLVTAVHDGDILAANIMVEWRGRRVYLHGASGDLKRNLMAPYLLHWTLMVDAKAKGLAEYDWWGIAPEGAEGHKLAGVTRFKLGFGGERVCLPHTCDFVSRKLLYSLYGLARRIRR